MRWRRTFLLVCASTIGGFIAQGLLYPALPLYLTEELGTTKATAGLVVSSLAITSLLTRPVAGAMADRIGRKPLLIAGPLLTMVTAVGLLMFGSVLAVLLLRLVQGIGSALSYSGAGPIVADVAPVEKRASMLALFTLFFYVGIAVGPFLAELLIERTGYRAVWWSVIGFCAAGLLLGLLVPETGTAPDARVRLPWQHRVFHPATRRTGATYFCIGTGWAAVAAFLALYARDIGLRSSDGLFLTLAVTVMATRFTAGDLADRLGRQRVAVPSVGLTVVGLAWLAAFRSPWNAVIGLVVFGVGFSGAFPALFASVVDAAPEHERGAAMSSFNIYYDLGAPLGGYGVGVLVDHGGFGLGFGATAVLAAVGWVLLVVLGRPARAADAGALSRRRRGRRAPQPSG